MKHQYDEVLRGCQEIVDFLCLIDMDFIFPVALYNIFAISKLSYIASFVIPPRAVLQVERGVLQRPMRGPHRLKLLGLKVEQTSIEWWSLASSCSDARSASKRYWDLYDGIQQAIDDEDRAVVLSEFQ